MVGGTEKERTANVSGWDETQPKRQFYIPGWSDVWVGISDTEIRRRITAWDILLDKSRRGDGRFHGK